MSDGIRALYGRLEELETERWQRGLLDRYERPLVLGLAPTSVVQTRDVTDGSVILNAADDHGCKIGLRLTAELARDLGLQDPEGHWRREYERVVIHGAKQKDRDEVYRAHTGSRENSFWNSLERTLGVSSVVSSEPS